MGGADDILAMNEKRVSAAEQQVVADKTRKEAEVKAALEKQKDEERKFGGIRGDRRDREVIEKERASIGAATGDGGAAWRKKALLRAQQRAEAKGISVADSLADTHGSMDVLRAQEREAKKYLRANPDQVGKIVRPRIMRNTPNTQCHKFKDTGSCERGDKCRFAHGADDKRFPTGHGGDSTDRSSRGARARQDEGVDKFEADRRVKMRQRFKGPGGAEPSLGFGRKDRERDRDRERGRDRDDDRRDRDRGRGRDRDGDGERDRDRDRGDRDRRDRDRDRGRGRDRDRDGGGDRSERSREGATKPMEVDLGDLAARAAEAKAKGEQKVTVYSPARPWLFTQGATFAFWLCVLHRFSRP